MTPLKINLGTEGDGAADLTINPLDVTALKFCVVDGEATIVLRDAPSITLAMEAKEWRQLMLAVREAQKGAHP